MFSGFDPGFDPAGNTIPSQSAESFQSFEPEFLEALESLKSSQSSDTNNPLPTTSYKAVVRPDAIKTYRAGSEDSGNYISSRWTFDRGLYGSE